MSSGPKQIGSATRRVAARILTKLPGQFVKLQLEWRDIVGPDYAAQMYPIKLAPAMGSPKSSSRTPSGGCLWVETTSATASLLHYAKDDICERINRYFGTRLVVDIRFQHANRRTLMDEAHVKRAELPLVPEVDNAIVSLAATVDHAALSQALTRFGRALSLMKNRIKS